MPVTINIPSPLRRLAGNSGTVSVEGKTVGQALINLESAFPSFEGKLIDSKGAVKSAIKVFVTIGGAKTLAQPDTLIGDGDEITIVPAAFGG